MLYNIYIFPTDTVYGIGASIYDIKSIKRIFEIKNREKEKPLPVLCSNLKQINQIAYLDELSIKVINELMPGELTLILKSKIHNELYQDTIAVRIPNNDLALKILNKYGPLATTSVNISHEKELNDYNIIKERYHNLVTKIYKSSYKSSSRPSTIYNMTNFEIVREGNIKLEDINRIIKTPR